jgi:hypothetical protein
MLMFLLILICSRSKNEKNNSRNWVAAAASNAQSVTMQCGGFTLEIIANSMSKINGEYVTSQK